MDVSGLVRRDDATWELPRQGAMRVPEVFYGTRELIEGLDHKVVEQATNVAGLPRIVGASYVMPDGHWGYGFPIGGVAAFRADSGVISPGGIGFDINCGMRLIPGTTRRRLPGRRLASARCRRSGRWRERGST